VNLLGQTEDLLGLETEFEGFDIGKDLGSNCGGQTNYGGQSVPNYGGQPGDSNGGGVDLMGDAISSSGACMVPFGQSQQNNEAQHRQPGHFHQASHSSGESPLAGFAQPMQPQGSMKPVDPFADLLG